MNPEISLESDNGCEEDQLRDVTQVTGQQGMGGWRGGKEFP